MKRARTPEEAIEETEAIVAAKEEATEEIGVAIEVKEDLTEVAETIVKKSSTTLTSAKMSLRMNSKAMDLSL